MSDDLSPPDEPAPLEGTTILVTDDDLGVRMVIGLLLEQAGSTVVEAGDGQEAVGIVQRRCRDIDAVLLDVMMPRLNGPEALPGLRAACPGLPVVFFSGFDRNAVADQLVDPTGYTSFLPKPCDRDTLVAELRRAADRRR
jgi:CheY-like chemotaxis protein